MARGKDEAEQCTPPWGVRKKAERKALHGRVSVGVGSAKPCGSSTVKLSTEENYLLVSMPLHGSEGLPRCIRRIACWECKIQQANNEKPQADPIDESEGGAR